MRFRSSRWASSLRVRSCSATAGDAMVCSARSMSRTRKDASSTDLAPKELEPARTTADQEKHGLSRDASYLRQPLALWHCHVSRTRTLNFRFSQVARGAPALAELVRAVTWSTYRQALAVIRRSRGHTTFSRHTTFSQAYDVLAGTRRSRKQRPHDVLDFNGRGDFARRKRRDATRSPSLTFMRRHTTYSPSCVVGRRAHLYAPSDDVLTFTRRRTMPSPSRTIMRRARRHTTRSPSRDVLTFTRRPHDALAVTRRTHLHAVMRRTHLHAPSTRSPSHDVLTFTPRRTTYSPSRPVPRRTHLHAPSCDVLAVTHR
jgi:hypothetical protein